MPETGKTRFRPRWRTLFLFTVLGAICWSAYSYWSEYSERAARKARDLMAPAVGAQCTVILRKGELGIDSSRLWPTEIATVVNNVQGKFIQLNDEWIVLTAADQQQVWIPRGHVLLMRVGR